MILKFFMWCMLYIERECMESSLIMYYYMSIFISYFLSNIRNFNEIRINILGFL